MNERIFTGFLQFSQVAIFLNFCLVLFLFHFSLSIFFQSFTFFSSPPPEGSLISTHPLQLHNFADCDCCCRGLLSCATSRRYVAIICPFLCTYYPPAYLFDPINPNLHCKIPGAHLFRKIVFVNK